MEGIDGEKPGKFHRVGNSRAGRSVPTLMKWFLALAGTTAVALLAQTDPAREIKHLWVPTSTSVRPSSVSAAEVEREGNYPAVIHLKGSVEIKTPYASPAVRKTLRFATGMSCCMPTPPTSTRIRDKSKRAAMSRLRGKTKPIRCIIEL